MRKVTAIFFLFLFGISNTEAAQVLKLPLLIQHFVSHIDSGRSESLGDFLNQHYFSGHEDDGDENQDQKLPFKNIHMNIGATFLLSPSPGEMPAILVAAGVIKSYHSDYIPSPAMFAIFHPPRLV